VFGHFRKGIFGSGQTQPLSVRWSREADPLGDEEMKCISHAGIDMWIGRPSFTEDETRVYLSVRNQSRKALGFGAPGIGLVLTSGAQTRTLTCKALMTLMSDMVSEQPHERVIVDIARSPRGEDFTAVFAPARKPTCVEIVIQANRILAAPYFFWAPFQIDSNSIAAQSVMQNVVSDPVHAEQIDERLSTNASEGSVTSKAPLIFDGGYFLSDFYDPYLQGRRWMCIDEMKARTEWNPQVPATPKNKFISSSGELYQDISDYGTVDVPPSDHAMRILSAMTAEEKLNLHDVLKQLQVRMETITKTPGILLHPDKRAGLWGKAIANISDHYYQIGNQQRALFFMEAAWNLSKHPLFAVHAGLLKSRAGDLAQAKGLLENYLAEYRNVRSVVLNSVYPFIKEEELESVAQSAREALASISWLLSQKN
jgi:hypothetical protein